jgi:hypothetical protein
MNLLAIGGTEMKRCASPWPLLYGAMALAVMALSTARAEAADLPDPRLTPGGTLPVKAPEVCRPGYSPSALRALTPLQWHDRRAQVFQAYGIETPARGAYVINHLVPLEIGGSNELVNLWPLAKAGTWNAARKAKLTRRLHRIVCSGRLSLQEAQRETAVDWIAAYRRLVSAR